MQQYIQLTNTPSDQPLNDAPHPSTQASPDEYIHNFSNIPWNMEEEPPVPDHTSSHCPPPLYYLLTITGQLIVASYPHDTHTLGAPDAHYLAWAPLTSEAKLTLH